MFVFGYFLFKIRLMYKGPHSSHHHRQKRIRKESHPRREIVVTTSANEEKIEIGGLQPYSLYSLTVSVFNSKGDGPESEDRPFQMPEGGKKYKNMYTKITYVF